MANPNKYPVRESKIKKSRFHLPNADTMLIISLWFLLIAYLLAVGMWFYTIIVGC